MEYEDLPDFLQERVNKMPKEARQPFLNTITPEWLEAQKACKELDDGLKDGRWTQEEIIQAAKIVFDNP